jgi:hypothetical protein
MKNRLPAIIFHLLAFLSGAAEAGRPLQTEDAGVLDRGDCELELVAARERGEHPTVDSGRGQLGCGIGLRSQVALALGRAQGDGERADLAGLVGKSALLPLTEESTGVALAWAVGFARPRGGDFDRESYEVRAVVTHPIGAWLLHGNVGWSRSEVERLDRTVWGAAVERTGLGPVDAMFEFFGERGERAWANAGLRWNAVPGKVFVDGSYGRQMQGDGESLVTLGLKLAF